jgi:hypothetical protein
MNIDHTILTLIVFTPLAGALLLLVCIRARRVPV